MPKEQFLSYQKENHHPSQPPVLDAVGSVLNALCVTKGYTWKEAYCKLIAVAGKIGQMPQYPKTIRELLHEEGFFLQAKTNVNKCIREIIADCNRSFHDGEVVILNLSVGHTNTDDGEYCPLWADRQSMPCTSYRTTEIGSPVKCGLLGKTDRITAPCRSSRAVHRERN